MASNTPLEGPPREHIEAARTSLVKQMEDLAGYYRQLNTELKRKSDELEAMLGYRDGAKAQIIGLVDAINAIQPLLGGALIEPPIDLKG